MTPINRPFLYLIYFTGRYVPQPTTAPPYGSVGNDRISTSTNWAILLYPEPTKSTEATEDYKTPSMLPVPPPNEDDDKNNNANYVDYDQKWNEEEAPEEEEPPEVEIVK